VVYHIIMAVAALVMNLADRMRKKFPSDQLAAHRESAMKNR
jgi:hypothetical protein